MAFGLVFGLSVGSAFLGGALVAITVYAVAKCAVSCFKSLFCCFKKNNKKEVEKALTFEREPKNAPFIPEPSPEEEVRKRLVSFAGLFGSKSSPSTPPDDFNPAQDFKVI